MNAPVTAIVGAGAGLGAALAERFARGGHAVALITRTAASREAALAAVEQAGGHAQGWDADATDPAAMANTFAQIRSRLGDPTVLICNTGSFTRGGILDLTPETFDAAWRANCYSGFLAAREVLPAMQRAHAGTVLFTGATASLRGGAGFAGLAVGKFGQRALAQSLARECGPQGIHVAHVVIDGQIDSAHTRARDPGHRVAAFIDPAAIAETYWLLHTQPPSAWTQEIDLRPGTERF